jgi:hypothetical protein
MVSRGRTEADYSVVVHPDKPKVAYPKWLAGVEKGISLLHQGY